MRWLALVLLAACSDGARPRAAVTDTTTPPGTPNEESSEAVFEEAATPCEDSATHVYVFTDSSDLYRFRPADLVFEKVGHVSCDTQAANSMAVDRFGNAWVNYHSGRLVEVSTRNAACRRTAYEPGQGGFLSFGSGFATKGPGSSEETLFVDAHPAAPAGFAKVDLSTMRLSKIGSYPGELANVSAELSGTGDGRLYGFFTTKPNATLARIDQQTGQTSELRVLEGVSTPDAFAFSFWGGDFWFYTSVGGASKVTRLRTADDRLEVVVPDVGGFRIVGAGVSTCAPLTYPR